MSLEHKSSLPVNPPACFSNGWRRLTLFFMNNEQAEPLHPAHAVFIFARLQTPPQVGDDGQWLATAAYRALPHLAHTYRTYVYDASQLMVREGQIHPAPDPAHNIRLLYDPSAPAEFAPFVAYCMANIPRFGEPLCIRYTPNGHMHLCFSHALVDGLEMVSFMNQLADCLAAEGFILAEIEPLMVDPLGEYHYFHEYLPLEREAAEATIYHRAVYELGVRWRVQHINQLVAGDVPERKVSLAKVRFMADWPTFLGRNRVAIGRGKRWCNLFGFWSWLLARGVKFPLVLYRWVAEWGWLERGTRPWTTGNLQVSAMRLAVPRFLMFPVRHPAQGRAVVLGAVWWKEGRPWVQVSGVTKKPSRSGRP